MKTTSFLLILAGFVSISQGRLIHNDGDEVPSPSIARVLATGLKPTLPPYEPPGFKPTTTPTDRTKKPTAPPTRRPTLPLPPTPTMRPTAPYRCGLCRANENPKFPKTVIAFENKQQTCAYVDSLGDLTGLVDPSDCNYFRLLGTQACSCSTQPPPPTNNCLLCENGSALRYPNKAVLGGVTCTSVQNSAQTDKASDCYKYQGGIGSYCGCYNPIASAKVCRLCGSGKKLPFPNRQVNGASCLEHEFTATFALSCSATKKAVAAQCCTAT
ncbi:hypothetical protein MHU86_5555 [Fragilaria crotonensis]|nr:hypothetical protein MHU86_5555 [Fragilaria crotonensis]